MIASEPESDLPTIIRWVQGRLDTSTSAVVAEAATSDPRVHQIFVWLRGFYRAAAELPLPAPPPVVRNAPRADYSRPPGAPPPVEVVARMLFDSRQDVAPAELLLADDRTTHLAFACDLADVVLDVRRLGSGRVRAEGRVLPADDLARAFTVAASGPRMTPVHASATDANGGFRLSELPDRVAKLRLASGELAVVVQFDVGWPLA